MAFAQRTMQTPDPPNPNHCCWVRVYNLHPPSAFTYTYSLPSSTSFSLPSHEPSKGEAKQPPPTPHSCSVFRGAAKGETSTTAPCVSPHSHQHSFTRMPQTATDVEMESMLMSANWSPPSSHTPAHGSIVPTMFDLSLSPAPRKGHNQCKDSYIVPTLVYKSRLEMVAYIALGQTDTQTDTGTFWRGWVCLLRVFAETKDDKSEVWQSGCHT